jgi:hypothetical protein
MRFSLEMLRTMGESVISSRAQLAARAGITFGGKRDLYKALGYERILSPALYRQRFERGGVAARLVKAFPNATWSEGGPQIYDDENVKTETKFEKDVKAAFKRLKIVNVLRRLDILCGLGRYSVLLIGREGEEFNFEEPYDSKSKRKITYLQPYGEERATIATWVVDEKDERFGLPAKYQIKANKKAAALAVDYTHVIHFVENQLENEVYGEPRLRAVWNDLDDLDKLKGGGAEAAWRRAHMGMHANVDPEATAGLTDDELQAEMDKVAEQLDEYDNNLRRFIRTTGIDVKTLDGSPFNFDANVRSIVSLIAATTDIPQRKLMGSGIGEMTGKMEDDTFNDVVTERRGTTAELLVRDVVMKLVESGEVAEPKNGEFKVDWPTEEELDEQGKATLSVSIANANKLQKDAGGEPIMTGAEIREEVWGMDPIDPEELKKMAEAQAAMQPQPAVDPNAPKQQGAPGSPSSPGAAVPKRKVGAPAKQTAAPPKPGQKPAAQRAAAAAALVVGGGAAAQLATHRIVDGLVPQFEESFQAALAACRDEVDIKALERALESGNRHEAEQLLMKAMDEFGKYVDEQF